MSFFSALEFAFKRELKEIKESYYKLFLVTLFPVVSFIALIATFYSGVLRELPIVVVDSDKSKISRNLLTNIESSPTLKIAYSVNSSKEALSLVKDGSVYAYIYIPPHFQRDVMLKKQPQVIGMINTQYILVGKVLKSALNSVVMQSAGAVEYVKSLATYSVSSRTKSSISPIGIQVTPLFNTYQNYFLFLVSALLPSILQIFVVVGTLVAFGTLFRDKRDASLFKGGYIEAKIIGTTLPYTISYTLLGIFSLLYIYEYLGWEFQGSYAVTFFGLFLMVVAYQAIALLFFVAGFNYARSLSLGALFTAPAFAFLGVTFPVDSMNSFAQFWRGILPISHFMELEISQANYGISPLFEVDKLLSLFSFWIVFILLFYIFRKRVAQ
jgi:ABC-2 type transport system permease protein